MGDPQIATVQTASTSSSKIVAASRELLVSCGHKGWGYFERAISLGLKFIRANCKGHYQSFIYLSEPIVWPFCPNRLYPQTFDGFRLGGVGRSEISQILSEGHRKAIKQLYMSFTIRYSSFMKFSPKASRLTASRWPSIYSLAGMIEWMDGNEWKWCKISLLACGPETGMYVDNRSAPQTKMKQRMYSTSISCAHLWIWHEPLSKWLVRSVLRCPPPQHINQLASESSPCILFHPHSPLKFRSRKVSKRCRIKSRNWRLNISTSLAATLKWLCFTEVKEFLGNLCQPTQNKDHTRLPCKKSLPFPHELRKILEDLQNLLSCRLSRAYVYDPYLVGLHLKVER